MPFRDILVQAINKLDVKPEKCSMCSHFDDSVSFPSARCPVFNDITPVVGHNTWVDWVMNPEKPHERKCPRFNHIR